MKKFMVLIFTMVIAVVFGFAGVVQAEKLKVPNLIPYDDNKNRSSIRPYANNTLLDLVPKSHVTAGTYGSVVDLGFAVGQHFCYAIITGTVPSDARIIILGSANNSDKPIIGTITYSSSTGDSTKVVSITGSPARYISAKWDSETGASMSTGMTVRCVSGGN